MPAEDLAAMNLSSTRHIHVGTTLQPLLILVEGHKEKLGDSAHSEFCPKQLGI